LISTEIYFGVLKLHLPLPLACQLHRFSGLCPLGSVLLAKELTTCTINYLVYLWNLTSVFKHQQNNIQIM